MENDSHRYQPQDVDHIVELDRAVTMFEAVEEARVGKTKREVVVLSIEGEEGQIKAGKTFRKVLKGFIQGTASELTRDGFGKNVREVFDSHKKEREEMSGER